MEGKKPDSGSLAIQSSKITGQVLKGVTKFGSNKLVGKNDIFCEMIAWPGSVENYWLGYATPLEAQCMYMLYLRFSCNANSTGIVGVPCLQMKCSVNSSTFCLFFSVIIDNAARVLSLFRGLYWRCLQTALFGSVLCSASLSVN